MHRRQIYLILFCTLSVILLPGCNRGSSAPYGTVVGRITDNSGEVLYIGPSAIATIQDGEVFASLLLEENPLYSYFGSYDLATEEVHYFPPLESDVWMTTNGCTWMGDCFYQVYCYPIEVGFEAQVLRAHPDSHTWEVIYETTSDNGLMPTSPMGEELLILRYVGNITYVDALHVDTGEYRTVVQKDRSADGEYIGYMDYSPEHNAIFVVSYVPKEDGSETLVIETYTQQGERMQRIDAAEIFPLKDREGIRQLAVRGDYLYLRGTQTHAALWKWEEDGLAEPILEAADWEFALSGDGTNENTGGYLSFSDMDRYLYFLEMETGKLYALDLRKVYA